MILFGWFGAHDLIGDAEKVRECPRNDMLDEVRTVSLQIEMIWFEHWRILRPSGLWSRKIRFPGRIYCVEFCSNRQKLDAYCIMHNFFA